MQPFLVVHIQVVQLQAVEHNLGFHTGQEEDIQVDQVEDSQAGQVVGNHKVDLEEELFHSQVALVEDSLAALEVDSQVDLVVVQHILEHYKERLVEELASLVPSLYQYLQSNISLK